MANKAKYVCTECGWESAGWVGKCANCGAWGSMVQQDSISTDIDNIGEKFEVIQGDETHKPIEKKRWEVALKEVNMALGGGIVHDASYLFSGKPGIGKSTLLLQLISKIAQKYKIKVAYVSSEESANQVLARLQRLGGTSKNIVILSGKEIGTACRVLEKLKPFIVVWDSLQSFYSKDITGIIGGVSQIKFVTDMILKHSRSKCTSIIIGQVTKKGVVAGPKLVEHIVDAVYYVDDLGGGIEHRDNLRIVYPVKNRFGRTDVAGIIKVEKTGFVDVTEDIQLFSSDAKSAVGTVHVPIKTGNRVLFVEIQALVTPSLYGFPRVIVQGLSKTRVEIIIGVLRKFARIPFGKYDVAVSVAGGVTISDPFADIGIATAIFSSLKNKPISFSYMFVGEIMLNGGIVSPPDVNDRVGAAVRVGATSVVTAASQGNCYTVKNVKDLLKFILMGNEK